MNEDLPVEPDPDIPGQDELGKLPVQPDSPELPAEDEQPEDLLAQLDEVQKQFESGLEEADDGEAIEPGDFPNNDPEPFDATVVPSIQPPTISDGGSVGFDDEFGGIDFSKNVSDEEAPGKIPELEAVDEAGKALEEFGAGVEAFHAGNAPEGDMPGDEADNPGFLNDNSLKDFLDADYRQKDASTSILSDATRRIEEITARLERSRL